MDYVKKYIRVFLNITVPLACALLLYFLGGKLISFFMPFIVGYLIACMANPLVKFLEKRLKILRKHGSMIVIILALAAVVMSIYLVVSYLVKEAISLTKVWPDYLAAFETKLQQVILNSDKLVKMLPKAIRDLLNQFALDPQGAISSWFSQFSSPALETAGDWAGKIVGKLPLIFVGIIVGLLSSYFFVADRENLNNFLGRFIPGWVKEYAKKLNSRIKQLIGGYFKAQFRIMFVVFIILGVGFFILKVPFYGLWAALIAILDFLPLFGTGTALIPWALFSALSGDYRMAVGLIIIYLVAMLTRQLLQPKIVGDTMGLSPMASLFFMFLGFKFAGLGGMILAVPVGMLFMELFDYGLFDYFILNVKVLAQDVGLFRHGYPVPKDIVIIDKPPKES